MARLSVLHSSSGKTVELEVGPNARVDAVQQTLAELTGTPKADQILMCEGARLDGAKPLSAYGLPGEEHDKVHAVFLYSRAHLRPDAALPPPEQLPDCPLDLSGLEGIQQQRHRLDEAGSPLLRLLPDYQRQFQAHLLTANAAHEASQQRMATCSRLVSEQEVQALSIDAATSNVELHYAYICDAFGAFMSRYQHQHAQHAEVLSRFEADLHYLASIEVHPALRGSEEGAASLLGLVNAEALRQSAAACSRGHQHFAGKVAELEGLFGMLKADVEALFMQAPSVDLEALTAQLEEQQAGVDEQGSIVAALSSDLAKVQQLVEQAGEAAAADPAASVHVSDTVHMLETMRETHVGHLLPRVDGCRAGVEGFAVQCLDCKNALTRDVFTQLRTISSQQSKIREMKNKLALFREALARQEASVQELLVLRRVPAAYKQCLAECVRRGAFMEKYAHSAAQLAERMGGFREKELGMRDAFRKHVERLIPAQLLERMGLLEQPPHCQVSVSAAEGERLLCVTVDDVRRIQLPWGAASLLALPPSPAAVTGLHGSGGGAGGGGGGGGNGGSASGGSSREGSMQQPSAAEAAAAAEEAAAAVAEVDVTSRLQLENAKLRAEVASQIAVDCIRAAQQAGASSSGMSASHLASASGQASPQLAQITAGSPRLQSMASAGLLPPDAAQRFERALAAKDGLAGELQSQLAASRRQAAAYEARILQLEHQLSSIAASAAAADIQVQARQSAAPASASAEAQPSVTDPGSQPAFAAAPMPGPALLASSASSSAAGSKGSLSAASSRSAFSAAAEAVPFAAGVGSGSGGSVAGSLTAAAASTSLPASPTSQQGASRAEQGLPSSVDAAAGTSVSGSLHAPDPSRSLGVCLNSSSSPVAASQYPPLQHPQQQQQQQQQMPAAVGLQQQQTPAAVAVQQIGGAVQAATTTREEQPQPEQSSQPGSGSLHLPAAAQPPDSSSLLSASASASAGAASQISSDGSSRHDEASLDPAPAAALAASSECAADTATATAAASAGPSAEAQEQIPAVPATDAASPSPEVPVQPAASPTDPAAATAMEEATDAGAGAAPEEQYAAAAEAGHSADAEEGMPQSAPPPQLLASVVVDEGSDVEGIEAVDNSSEDEEAPSEDEQAPSRDEQAPPVSVSGSGTFGHSSSTEAAAVAATAAAVEAGSHESAGQQPSGGGH